MTFIIIIWLLTLIIGYKYSMIRVGNNRFVLSHIFPKIKHKTLSKNIIKAVASFRFFTTPGWFVSKTINSNKTNLKLKQSHTDIDFDQYLRFKQFALNMVVFLFWILFFFNLFSLKGFIYFVFLGSSSYYFIDIWLWRRCVKYKDFFREEMPYFIDMVALTLETGMNIEQALVYITNNGRTRLSALLKKNLKTIDMGKTLEDVLLDMKKHLPILEFENFISSILQSKKLGVSLAETLKIQSDLIRTQRRQQAEELGRKAAVKISVPLVFFIFPALLIIYIGPGILRLMQAAG